MQLNTSEIFDFFFLISEDKIALNGNIKDLEARGVPEESRERSSVFAVFKKVNSSSLFFLCDER